MGKLPRSDRADERSTTEFDALFGAHFISIIRYAERRLPETEMAEEIAAETFLAAWKRLESKRPVDLAWLYKVASRRIADHYRGKYRHQALEIALARAVEEPPAELDRLEVMALHEVVKQLSDREREVVMLHYWEGLSAAEIGIVLGTSEGAVWAILSRARGHLRGLLSDSENPRPVFGGEKHA